MFTFILANGIIKTDVVANAMMAVDRKNYCPYAPYHDSPQSIGYSATISAPHMVKNFDDIYFLGFNSLMRNGKKNWTNYLYFQHAHALEKLKTQLVPGEKALDVGSGSGYLTSCMAMMVGETGRVVGIDHIPELVALATKNIQKDNPTLLSSERIKLIGIIKYFLL